MATVVLTEPQTSSMLSDVKFKQELQRLRQTDNRKNWFYLIRTYVLIATTIGGAVWFYFFQVSAGFSFLWNLPVVFAAILMIGALQHHLASLAHEAVHHSLFRNRYLNDMISEWFCSFPMFSSTFHYGLHHLAHHQFVNDPVRDPDISQMQMSGHRLSFPVLKQEFISVLLQQLWLPNLVRYSLARAEYDSLGTEKNPYIRKDWKPSKLPARIGLAYLAWLVLMAIVLGQFGNAISLFVLPLVAWVAVMTVYALLPENVYYQSKIRPLFSVRSLIMMRTTFLTVMFAGLAWGSWKTGVPWMVFFFLLWVVPLITSFPLFMVLRQIVQHGNADRGWLTNSRVFRCNPLISFAVFPLGQDYHLPHHMFATVPHYRLRELHQLMLQYPGYEDQVTVVEGYFLPKQRPPVSPTVMDVLGPEFAPQEFHEVYIDNTVLEQQRVKEQDRNDIVREGQREADRIRKIAAQRSIE